MQSLAPPAPRLAAPCARRPPAALMKAVQEEEAAERRGSSGTGVGGWVGLGCQWAGPLRGGLCRYAALEATEQPVQQQHATQLCVCNERCVHAAGMHTHPTPHPPPPRRQLLHLRSGIGGVGAAAAAGTTTACRQCLYECNDSSG